MNTTQLLARAQTRLVPGRHGTRTPATDGDGAAPAGGHGRAARTAIAAALVVVGVVIGSILAVALRDEPAPTAPDDSAQIAELRDRIDTLTEARDAANANAAELDAQIATLEQRIADLRAAGDADQAELDRLTQSIATLTSERDAARATVTDLQQQVADAEDAAAQAAADLAALRARFPLGVGGLLGVDEMTGTYRASVAQVYCSTTTACRAPALRDASIVRTQQGFLRLRLPGFVETDLARAGDAFHAVVDTTTAAGSCGTARPARVTVTVAGDEYRVGSNGSIELTTLQAVATVDAPATTGCPATLAVFEIGLA